MSWENLIFLFREKGKIKITNKTFLGSQLISADDSESRSTSSCFLGSFMDRVNLSENSIQISGPQRVSIYYLLISKIDRDMRPPAKLSYRSAIHKKVVFGSGDAWTLPQIQGEVGGDQEPPGNTWRYPMGSKFFLLILNHI